MDISVFFVIFFGLGVILEGFLLLRGKLKKQDWFFIAGSVLCGFIAFFIDFDRILPFSSGLLPSRFESAFGILAITFAFAFKDRILPNINERSVLVWNLIFLYFFAKMPIEFNFLSVLAAIFTLLVLANAYFTLNLNKFFKIILYAWFLIMILLIANEQFFDQKASLLSGSAFDLNYSIAFILGGMAFLFIFSHLIYFYELLPISFKEDDLKDWRMHVDMIAGKYSKRELHWTETTLTILILGVAFLVNYKFEILSEWLLVSVVITMISFKSKLLQNRQ